MGKRGRPLSARGDLKSIRLALYRDQFAGLDRAARDLKLSRVGLIRLLIDNFIGANIRPNDETDDRAA